MKKQNNHSYNLIELTPCKGESTNDTKLSLNDDSDDDITITTDYSTNSIGTEYFDPAHTKPYGLLSQPKKIINPWSRNYIGIVISYTSVGMIYGGSTSILYPILIIHEGVTSSLYTACISLVTIFWSYKIIFGMFSDVCPILGYKRKSYITLGWLICAFTLLYVCVNSKDTILDWKYLVLMFTLANMGYVMADVSADASMVHIANNHECKDKKGNMQTLVYSCFYFGQVIINILLLFGFSGPDVNCVGYERDINVECTDDTTIANRNEFYKEYPDDWCHMKCSNATFNFGLSVSEYTAILATINMLCIPFYLLLNEEKQHRHEKTTMQQFLSSFWIQLQRRAAWQLILYVMISNITFGVINAAKPTSNYIWLHLTTTQNQIMILLEKCMFVIGLTIIRKYALHFSWRLLIVYGSILVTTLNLSYYFIIYDVVRYSWFYIFMDVSSAFSSTLNFMSTGFAMVEISEPGFEAVTYALITTASNAVIPLSSVISYQFLAFFPELNTQESMATDTANVRNQFATLHAIIILVNLSSLVALPMLPRQKDEIGDIVQNGGTSYNWGCFTLCSIITFLLYSTIVTFMTVAGADTYGCYKVLGGEGCSEDESSIPAYILVCIVFLYCYGVNFYLSFLPILKGQKKFSFSMFS